jgi:hypothetical protein
MAVEQRQAFAQQAFDERNRQAGAVNECPHLGALRPGALCNKSGGVCSIRPYSADNPETESLADSMVTICPSRFLEDGRLLRWVAQTMLGSSADILAVKETPFLRRTGLAVDPDEGSRAGRIDWVLVDPSTIASSALRWCALEMQSLYFSGHNMTDDFDRYRTATDLVFPARSRRPDYRSGGPKRLAPQLSIKVPLLARWGIKTAVLVDRYFFAQMSEMPEIRYGDHDDRLAEAELVWFVSDFRDGHLVEGEVHYASLADSITALNASEPMAKAEFIRNLSQVVANERNIGTKVFRLS